MEGSIETRGLAQQEGSLIIVSDAFGVGLEGSAMVNERRADNDNSIQKVRGEDELPFHRQSNGKEKEVGNDFKGYSHWGKPKVL